MKYLLNTIAVLLLVVILLTGLAAGEGEAQPGIESKPKELTISGVIGNSPFQHPFTVQALNGNITELKFYPSNLMEISRKNSWISGANVQITPAVDSIKKDQSQDFIVTVQNIPWSGQYNGTITVYYKEQTADAQDNLPILVRAANFSAVPPQIILKFEKSFFGHGGISDLNWTLKLIDESGLAPQEMIDALAPNARPILYTLVHSEDKSQVIPPDWIMNSEPTVESDRQGLMIKTNFTIPQVSAGKYTGTLEVRNESMGILATVPMEVHVRYSSWLARLLLLIGLLVSSAVSRLNTTVKKRNGIAVEAWELRKKVNNADITEDCRSKIEILLDEVKLYLKNNQFENAQSNIKLATTELEKCKIKKEDLNNKAGEIEGLINNSLLGVKTQVREFVDNEAPVVKDYLPSIKKALEKLNTKIKEEHYLCLTEQLTIRVKKEKEKINDLAELCTELGRFKLLIEWLKKMPNLDKEKVKEAETALKNCIGYLAFALIDNAKGHLINIEKAINAAIVEARRILEEELDKGGLTAEREITLRTMIYLENSLRISPSEATAAPPPSPPSQEVIAVTRYRLNLHAGPNESYRKVGKLEKDTKVSVIAKVSVICQNYGWLQVQTKSWLLANCVDAKDHDLGKVPFATSHIKDRVHLWLDRFHQWFTPKRQGYAIELVLYGMAILILLPIGFSQLYVNKITFGVTNVWQERLEYFALFLWGFGISTGRATVANVLSTFRGS